MFRHQLRRVFQRRDHPKILYDFVYTLSSVAVVGDGEELLFVVLCGAICILNRKEIRQS